MKTPEQLKGAIRNFAAEKNLRPQEVLQMFLFERILERLSASPYQDNFILKGGLLISSMIGIGSRTTMDMDTTVRGIPMEEEELIPIVKSILGTEVGDGVEFVYQRIEPIREDDTYNNFRVHMDAVYGKIKSPMRIDITTGDKITPAAIAYEFPLSFEDKKISVMAYTLETVLAEKYETVIRRNIATTRARDFYDLHTLYRLKEEQVSIPVLRLAVEHTAAKRGSLELMAGWREIISDIREEVELQRLWQNYIREHSYAEGLLFAEVVDTVEIIAGEING